MRNNDMSAALVAEGSVLFADIDEALAEVFAKAQRLVEIYEAGISEGMTHGLAAKELVWEARQIPGDVAALAAKFARLHTAGQKIAAKNGEDTGSLTRIGGIVAPMGGTR